MYKKIIISFCCLSIIACQKSSLISVKKGGSLTFNAVASNLVTSGSRASSDASTSANADNVITFNEIKNFQAYCSYHEASPKNYFTDLIVSKPDGAQEGVTAWKNSQDYNWVPGKYLDFFAISPKLSELNNGSSSISAALKQDGSKAYYVFKNVMPFMSADKQKDILMAVNTYNQQPSNNNPVPLSFVHCMSQLIVNARSARLLYRISVAGVKIVGLVNKANLLTPDIDPTSTSQELTPTVSVGKKLWYFGEDRSQPLIWNDQSAVPSYYTQQSIANNVYYSISVQNAHPVILDYARSPQRLDNTAVIDIPFKNVMGSGNAFMLIPQTFEPYWNSDGHVNSENGVYLSLLLKVEAWSNDIYSYDEGNHEVTSTIPNGKYNTIIPNAQTTDKSSTAGTTDIKTMYCYTSIPLVFSPKTIGDKTVCTLEPGHKYVVNITFFKYNTKNTGNGLGLYEPKDASSQATDPNANILCYPKQNFRGEPMLGNTIKYTADVEDMNNNTTTINIGL